MGHTFNHSTEKACLNKTKHKNEGSALSPQVPPKHLKICTTVPSLPRLLLSFSHSICLVTSVATRHSCPSLAFAATPHLVKAPFLQLLAQDFTNPGQAPHWLFPHGLCHEVSVLLGGCHLDQA